MKPKIEVGVWDTSGLFIAQVRSVGERASHGCIPGVQAGTEVSWCNQTLKCINPVNPEWDLVKRVGDLLSEDDNDFIFEPSKPKPEQGEFEIRVTQWTITPTGKPVFYGRAITLSIEDEAGGEFLTIKNGDDSNGGSFRFDPEEWPVLRALIDEAIKEVRK